MAKNKKGHWEVTYVFDPVSGIDKPESVWVEDEPIPEEEEVSVEEPGITPTTPTTPTGTTTATPNSFAWWLETYHPGSHTSEELIALNVEYVAWFNAQHFPPGTLAPPTTPTPTVEPTPTPEELIEGIPPVPTITPPTLAPAPTVTPAPTFEAPVVPTIPAVTPASTIPAIEVTPAPEYAPTEEEAAWAEMYGGTIADIIKARGEGIPEETINLMIRQNTQALQAREDENMRLMHNDMERRGITESGLVFYNEQKIKSATTTAIANSITDIQIKSALMKMASFENALGQAGQFLGYLADQSKMFYVGKMATWEAQTDANLIKYQAQISSDMEEWRMENQFNMVDWQANTQALFAKWNANTAATMEEWRTENQFNFAEWGAIADWDMALFQIEWNAEMAKWQAETDIYKMGINQAYAQDNMTLAAQIATDYAAARFEENKILLEMELEAARLAAEAEGAGTIIGGASGAIATIIAGK